MNNKRKLFSALFVCCYAQTDTQNWYTKLETKTEKMSCQISPARFLFSA